MSPEERQLLASLFDRVRTASATPRDREAENLIEQATREQPYAAYYLAQAVIVQEKGLEAAANRIRELEERVHELESRDSEHHRAEQGGGFLSSIFGSGSQQAPTHIPNQGPWSGTNIRRQPVREDDGNRAPPPAGPWNPQMQAPSAGGSFLRGALGTAAGVAGGMLLANSLSGIFGQHMSSLGLASPAETSAASDTPAEETVINNYYGDDAIRQAADTDDNNADDSWRQVSDDDYDDDSAADDDFGDDTMDV